MTAIENTPARGKWAALWQAMQPSPRTRRAAGYGGAVVALFLAAVMGRQVRSGLGSPIDMLGMMVAAVIILLLVIGILWLLGRLLVLATRFLGWVGTASALAVMAMFGASGVPELAVAALVVVLLTCLLAGSIAAVTRRQPRRLGLALIAAGSAVLLAGSAWWLKQPGTSASLAKPAAGAAATLGAPDPSLPGPYRVRTLTYGSGSDRRRSEFASGAALRTPSVDARPFLKDYRGIVEKIRRRYWGFGAEAFPLNGRVWYPEGAGPFPLVLIVHGNHIMGEYSDPGYAWLGELLASRGMIAVSVDENFLNVSLLGGGVPDENSARAWLLLEHLRQWRTWNGNAGNPFQGRVDLGRVALIGHSRGGEAVAIAGAFNRLTRNPDDARVAFDYGFGIRAIVAIAPTDGKSNPGDRPVRLENVDYLTLQGSQDTDISQFLGDRQYHRVGFTGDGDWFKASVYIDRANHGQFNTVWGRADQPAPVSWFLNLQPLLAGEEQRRAAAVCISGFLEAALRDQRAYRALFRDRLAPAAAWLPATSYLTRYEDSSFHLLADYDEDVDVTRTSAPGGLARGSGLAVWRVQDVNLRRKTPRSNYAVYLGWKPGTAASYALTLPDGFAKAAQLDPAALLVLDVADVDEDPDPVVERQRRASAPRRTQPLDLTVELRDSNGKVSRLPLSVAPPVAPRFTKWAPMEAMFGAKPEPVFETVNLPLAAFAAAAPGFSPADLQSVTFSFDRSARGVVAIDRIGFDH